MNFERLFIILFGWEKGRNIYRVCVLFVCVYVCLFSYIHLFVVYKIQLIL